jgi:hypothetical protein
VYLDAVLDTVAAQLSSGVIKCYETRIFDFYIFMKHFFKKYRIIQCAIGEEIQNICEGKEGVQLKPYPIGMDIAKVL